MTNFQRGQNFPQLVVKDFEGGGVWNVSLPADCPLPSLVEGNRYNAVLSLVGDVSGYKQYVRVTAAHFVPTADGGSAFLYPPDSKLLYKE